MKSSAVAPYLSLGMLLGFAAAAPPEVQAEIRSSGKKDLGTKVNGVKGGGYSGAGAGSVVVRVLARTCSPFSDFDTRGAIRDVRFQTGKARACG